MIAKVILFAVVVCNKFCATQLRAFSVPRDRPGLDMIGRVQADFTNVGLGKGLPLRCSSTSVTDRHVSCPAQNLASASVHSGFNSTGTNRC